jgi:ubiquinol-cytochrome c reductase cytochrome c1 subunit
MGCHSLEHQRYNRMARDIGLTDEQVKENLIFTGAKVGER